MKKYICIRTMAWG